MRRKQNNKLLFRGLTPINADYGGLPDPLERLQASKEKRNLHHRGHRATQRKNTEEFRTKGS
jgi:hypothetical protein